jgi:hypothetical protein
MLNDNGDPRWGRIALATLVSLLILILLTFGGCAATKSFNRYQKRADVKNEVTVTHTKIQVARQQAQIVNAEIAATKAAANKRYWEATGIRRAQDEIAKTLTPLYVQHEAIQKLPEARAIYVPSGANGIPQVYDVGATTNGK